MSLRSPPARTAPLRQAAPDGRFIFSFGRGDRHRRIVLSPGAFYAAAALIPAVAALYLGATAYLFFRDDMIAALMARHAHQQYAYEDRLAALRLQLDRIAGRQMLDQDSFDGKLREMATRQARIETRAAVLASLGDVVGTNTPDASAETRVAKKPFFSLPWTKARPTPAPVEVATPIDNPERDAPRPRPGDAGLRPSADASFGNDGPLPAAGPVLADVTADDVPASLRIGALAGAIERVEQAQVAALRRLEAPAAALASRLRAAIAATGLSPDRLKLPPVTQTAVGGPYVPLRIDARGSEFDAQLARTQAAVLSLDAVRRIVPSLPLRKPLAGPLEPTSSFGYRLDPFLGRPALHSGVDLRGEYGSPVRATAMGKVVTAGWSGGYGNMVEIEHATGVSTRYGHLSAVLVSEGQTVQTGAVVGRIGSTGRSTGNHLHYEVRLDEDAVDPSKFIRAAAMLARD